MPKTVKVAVVGSGLAGLTAAYLLSSTTSDKDIVFDVHLFEKAATLGMDSASVSISNGDQEWRIDVPMRSFQGGYYPHLLALYTKLGVVFRQADFAYSFSLFSHWQSEKGHPLRTTMIYNGASGRNGVGMPAWMRDMHLSRKGHRLLTRAVALGLFLLSAAQLLICFMRLVFFAIPVVRPKRTNTLTFEEWAAETVPRGVVAKTFGFDSTWRSFTQDVLIPLFSAICTVPEETVNAHPVEDLLDCVWLTFGTRIYMTVNGVRDVVSRLTANVKNIHLSSPIVSVHADSNNGHLVSIECATETGTVTHEGFHHIVFATQANRVVPLLSSYAASLPPDSPSQKAVAAQLKCVAAFPYERNVVINHTDAADALLPADPRDRRELNFVTTMPSMRDPPVSRFPHRILTPPPGFRATAPVFQTTNPFIAIQEDKIISAATLERAVLTMQSKAALHGLCRETRRAWWQCASSATYSLGELQGAGRRQSDERPGIWFCGAYAHVGIPLLEGCVVSAQNVCEGVCESEGTKPGSPRRLQ
ncbi:hypothetical protein C8R43DRAFT_1099128 [Mycena crocata]|nr:hypothetical protein C8R43DRAFT_1099128 [Mycena crocata]